MAGRYSDDEVEAILRRALEQQLDDEDGFARDEVVAAAREVGLDEGAIDRAIHEIESERDDEALRARLLRNERESWLRHFVTYLVIIGGLVGMHLLGFVGAWVAWAAFGWGIGLAMHTFKAFRGPTEEDVEKERERLNRKARRAAKARAKREARQRRRRRKAEREARRGEQRRVEDELEQVIEEGVALLLGAAAKKIREASRQYSAPPPDTEFNRYVAEKKGVKRPGERAAEPAAPDPLRARVEVFDDEDEGAPAETSAGRRSRRAES